MLANSTVPRRGRPPKGSKPTEMIDGKQYVPPQNLVPCPKRLMDVLGLVDGNRICNTCKRRSDLDEEYLSDPRYTAPKRMKDKRARNGEDSSDDGESSSPGETIQLGEPAREPIRSVPLRSVPLRGVPLRGVPMRVEHSRVSEPLRTEQARAVEFARSAESARVESIRGEFAGSEPARAESVRGEPTYTKSLRVRPALGEEDYGEANEDAVYSTAIEGELIYNGESTAFSEVAQPGNVYSRDFHGGATQGEGSFGGNVYNHPAYIQAPFSQATYSHAAYEIVYNETVQANTFDPNALGGDFFGGSIPTFGDNLFAGDFYTGPFNSGADQDEASVGQGDVLAGSSQPVAQWNANEGGNLATEQVNPTCQLVSEAEDMFNPEGLDFDFSPAWMLPWAGMHV
ncbi:hypothetical protein BC938DRAFT_476181 [Jimgerdemannia flammicorona]|uniref:Uncharacterized protein n=1 Tax=Jimgerdemannia flammicorona TaxID=994334 RepID=A0A433PJK8_9FUNG|nr:hypothetical protein BC938DRAFT_476181 [Jimgerdemannia flammicorona]